MNTLKHLQSGPGRFSWCALALVAACLLNSSPVRAEEAEYVLPAQTVSPQAPIIQQASLPLPSDHEATRLARLREHLRELALSRLVIMASRLTFNAAHHGVEQRGDRWVAHYKDISPETLSVQIKQLEGNSGKVVGLVRYAVLHYEASAATQASLAGQEFAMVKRLWQTEIFRYNGSSWK